MGVSLYGCSVFRQHCLSEPKAATIAKNISQMISDLLILLF